MKVIIKHTDGHSNVFAAPIIKDGEVEFNYKFEGMSYSQTLTISQCIQRGYVKKLKANNNFRSMVKGRIYPILSFHYSTGAIGHEQGDMIVRIPIDGGTHISNFEASF